jgi:hypothetical protein
METRSRLADIFKERIDYSRYHEQLRMMVEVDRDAGDDRTDRTRYLASLHPAPRWCSQNRHLRASPASNWFSRSKRALLKSRREWIGHSENWRRSWATRLQTSRRQRPFISRRRPEGLSEAEKFDYEMVIEEEAYPFEEQAIDVHTKNHELLASGIYNPWVQKSLNRLAILMPGRYAKRIRQLYFVLRLQDAKRARPGGR